MKAPPSAYWDNVVTELKKFEDEAIEAQYYLEKALDNIEEARVEIDVH